MPSYMKIQQKVHMPIEQPAIYEKNKKTVELGGRSITDLRDSPITLLDRIKHLFTNLKWIKRIDVVHKLSHNITLLRNVLHIANPQEIKMIETGLKQMKDVCKQLKGNRFTTSESTLEHIKQVETEINEFFKDEVFTKHKAGRKAIKEKGDALQGQLDARKKLPTGMHVGALKQELSTFQKDETARIKAKEKKKASVAAAKEKFEKDHPVKSVKKAKDDSDVGVKTKKVKKEVRTSFDQEMRGVQAKQRAAKQPVGKIAEGEKKRFADTYDEGVRRAKARSRPMKAAGGEHPTKEQIKAQIPKDVANLFKIINKEKDTILATLGKHPTFRKMVGNKFGDLAKLNSIQNADFGKLAKKDIETNMDALEALMKKARKQLSANKSVDMRLLDVFKDIEARIEKIRTKANKL